LRQIFGPARKARGPRLLSLGVESVGKVKKIVAAARKEGKLVIYAELDPDTRQALTSVFGRKFGIQLEFVAGKSAEIPSAISPRGAPTAVNTVF
jgi:hypothetical protein